MGINCSLGDIPSVTSILYFYDTLIVKGNVWQTKQMIGDWSTNEVGNNVVMSELSLL